MIAGAFVLPDVIVGMIEASVTRKPRMPCTRITLVARARRWFEECQRRSKNTPGAGVKVHLGHHPALPVPASSPIAKAGMEAQNVVRRAPNGSRQQMGDTFLENRVLWQPDRVKEALSFEVFVEVRQGESDNSHPQERR